MLYLNVILKYNNLNVVLTALHWSFDSSNPVLQRICFDKINIINITRFLDAPNFKPKHELSCQSTTENNGDDDDD